VEPEVLVLNVGGAEAEDAQPDVEVVVLLAALEVVLAPVPDQAVDPFGDHDEGSADIPLLGSHSQVLHGLDRVARRLEVVATVDQLAVGFTLGTTSLGLYSAAYLGNGFALRIPTLIGTVVYPRLQRELVKFPSEDETGSSRQDRVE
jgi:hypothetical protein